MDNVSPEKIELGNPEQAQTETLEKKGEGPPERPEASGRAGGREQQEQMDYQAAFLLEEPKNGSFLSALQLFVAWVKSVVADDKKDVL